jgi:hypothetical protein
MKNLARAFPKKGRTARDHFSDRADRFTAPPLDLPPGPDVPVLGREGRQSGVAAARLRAGIAAPPCRRLPARRDVDPEQWPDRVRPAHRSRDQGRPTATVLRGLGQWQGTEFFCDATDRKFPLESVIIEGLIAHIAATYRTFARREGRIIEGYSMAVTARRTSAASIPPTSALA